MRRRSRSSARSCARRNHRRALQQRFAARHSQLPCFYLTIVQYFVQACQPREIQTDTFRTLPASPAAAHACVRESTWAELIWELKCSKMVATFVERRGADGNAQKSVGDVMNVMSAIYSYER